MFATHHLARYHAAGSSTTENRPNSDAPSVAARVCVVPSAGIAGGWEYRRPPFRYHVTLDRPPRNKVRFPRSRGIPHLPPPQLFLSARQRRGLRPPATDTVCKQHKNATRLFPAAWRPIRYARQPATRLRERETTGGRGAKPPRARYALPLDAGSREKKHEDSNN